jgi:hypothetical protein
VRVSISEFTTLGASFDEDLVAYRAAGVEGIGVCEIKLGEGAAERLRESGPRRRFACLLCRRSCRCR